MTFVTIDHLKTVTYGSGHRPPRSPSSARRDRDTPSKPYASRRNTCDSAVHRGSGRNIVGAGRRPRPDVDEPVDCRALFTHAVEIPPRGMPLRGLQADIQRSLSLTLSPFRSRTSGSTTLVRWAHLLVLFRATNISLP
ncbi:hypothetical protein FAIPA1_460009 [Frankia sp. AiPs1]